MRVYYKNHQLESVTLFREGKILSALRKYDKKGNLQVMMYPLDTNRDAFVRIEYLDHMGKIQKSQAINEKPFSYYLFGASVHRSGPLEGTERN
jgi:antitoxin component YwqK of YwqJK toxin-antitoxin module